MCESAFAAAAQVIDQTGSTFLYGIGRINVCKITYRAEDRAIRVLQYEKTENKKAERLNDLIALLLNRSSSQGDTHDTLSSPLPWRRRFKNQPRRRKGSSMTTTTMALRKSEVSRRRRRRLHCSRISVFGHVFCR
jgi:hypothetical protein